MARTKQTSKKKRERRETKELAKAFATQLDVSEHAAAPAAVGRKKQTKAEKKKKAVLKVKPTGVKLYQMKLDKKKKQLLKKSRRVQKKMAAASDNPQQQQRLQKRLEQIAREQQEVALEEEAGDTVMAFFPTDLKAALPRAKKATRGAVALPRNNPPKGRRPATRLQPKSQEDLDFMDRQQSLWEQEQSIQWKRNNEPPQHKKRSARKGRSKQTDEQLPHALQWQPGTFAVSDAQKSTQQLVQEASQQVQGFSVGEATAGTTTSFQQQPPVAWTRATGQLPATWGTTTTSQPHPLVDDSALFRDHSNRWTALDEDDDSDNDGNKKPPARVFAFQPASFFAPPAGLCEGGDDPDL